MIYVHPSAVIDPGVNIGDYTSVWHFSHLEKNSVIGENCNLGQNVYVGNNAIVGNGCRLGNSVSIFSHVELSDFVFCAPFMVFTHITFPRAAVNRHASFRKTTVKAGVTLGVNSTVVPGITIGEGTFLAAGSRQHAHARHGALVADDRRASPAGWLG
jgi:UDP-2-acetamido-3-amino-2,3-dideoxy-glucuronate N-acetyltransferase